VDATSVVDPRDALIILSYVVGLPGVSGFRVGTLVSATCSPGEADTVAVFPNSLTLAPGDVFPMTAQVRDTAGVLLAGKSLAWATGDAAIATVDPTGAVTVLTEGTVTITAAVAPGITGSAAITVGPRRRWVVNPAGAQGQMGEVGSDVYPFSTIAAAVQRAAPGDTVFLVLGTYSEPLTAAKPLVFLGDSGAGGMPVITTPNGPLGTVDATPLPPGKVAVRRIEFRDAAQGLSIRADTVELVSLAFRGIQGPAAGATAPSYALIDGVQVSGAMRAGIAIDSAGFVRVLRSRVAGIEEDLSDTTFGIGVRADSAFFDFVEIDAVQGTGITTVGTSRTRVRSSTIRNVDGAGVVADSAVTLEVRDSVVVESVSAGGIGGAADTLVLSEVWVSRTGGAAVFLVDRPYVSATLLGVTATDVDGGFYGLTGQRAVVRNSSVMGAATFGIALAADTLVADTVTLRNIGGTGVDLGGASVAYVRASTIDGVGGAGGVSEAYYGNGYLEVTGTRIANVNVGEAIRFYGDSLRILNDTIAGTSQGGGIYHYLYSLVPGTWLRVDSTVIGGVTGQGIYSDGVALVDVKRTVVTGSAVSAWGLVAYDFDSVLVDSTAFRDNLGGAIYLLNGRTAVVRADTLDGNFAAVAEAGSGYSGNSALEAYYVGTSLVRDSRFTDNRSGALSASHGSADDTTVVENNLFRGAYQAIEAYGYDSLTSRLVVQGNTFVGRLTGNQTEQIGGYTFRSILIENNTVDSVSGYLTNLYRADSIIVRGNVATNVGGSSGGFLTLRAAALIENNSVSCVTGFQGYAYAHHTGDGTIRNNQATNCDGGVYAYNGLYTTAAFELDMRDNVLVGDTVNADPREGIILDYGPYRAAIARNSVRAFPLEGITVSAAGAAYRNSMVRVDSNVVRNVGGVGIRIALTDSAFVRHDTITGALGFAGVVIEDVDTAFVHRNSVTANAESGVWVQGTNGAVQVDTNLIADNGTSGIELVTPAAGRLNAIRRNGENGIYARTGTGAASVFPANDIEGNGYGVRNTGTNAIDVTNSWWGDASGPACDTCAGVGDSIGVNVTYAPFAAAPVVGVPAGAPPAAITALRAPARRPVVSAASRRPGGVTLERQRAGAVRERETPEPGLRIRRRPDDVPPTRLRVSRLGVIEGWVEDPAGPTAAPRGGEAPRAPRRSVKR
jgi:hypothetical protein